MYPIESASSGFSFDVKVLREINSVSFHSFCSMFHAKGAEQTKAFLSSSVRACELKATSNVVNRKSKEQHSSVQLKYKWKKATDQVLPYKW